MVVTYVSIFLWMFLNGRGGIKSKDPAVLAQCHVLGKTVQAGWDSISIPGLCPPINVFSLFCSGYNHHFLQQRNLYRAWHPGQKEGRGGPCARAVEGMEPSAQGQASPGLLSDLKDRETGVCLMS